MKNRNGFFGAALFVGVVTLSASCDDESSPNNGGSGGTSAGVGGTSAGVGGAIAGMSMGGSVATGGDDTAGAGGGKVPVGGDGNMGGDDGNIGGDGQGGMASGNAGASPEPMAGQGPTADGGAGGAGGDSSSAECPNAADALACTRPNGFVNRCTNDAGEFCVCQGSEPNPRIWNCFGGPGPTVDCGPNPMPGDNCSGGPGECVATPGCYCFNTKISCI